MHVLISIMASGLLIGLWAALLSVKPRPKTVVSHTTVRRVGNVTTTTTVRHTQRRR